MRLDTGSKQIQPVAVESAQAFVFSPDGKRIASVSENGQIQVIDLATQKVQKIQNDPIGARELVSQPAWKSNTELSFLVPAGAACGSVRTCGMALP